MTIPRFRCLAFRETRRGRGDLHFFGSGSWRFTASNIGTNIGVRVVLTTLCIERAMLGYLMYLHSSNQITESCEGGFAGRPRLVQNSVVECKTRTRGLVANTITC